MATRRPTHWGMAMAGRAYDLVRVLVVEDDPSLRELARVVLEDAGCRVATAADGEQAVASATEYPPDVIVLDLGLPERTGEAVAESLRAQDPTREVRIVVVTGTEDARARASHVVTGADALLRKPYEPTDLVDAVLAAARDAARDAASSPLPGDRRPSG